MIQEKTQRPLGHAKALALGLLLAALMSASLMLAAKPAHAAKTFTVNDTGDGEDVNVGDGECDAFRLVAKPCTLRAAIQEANHPNNPGPDTISFAIGVEGVKTIRPASKLPEITESLTIDGYTQPGATKNTNATGAINANPLIELDGSNAVSLGLVIRADDVVVRGLVINRFNSDGVLILANANNPEPTGVEIEGNFIGTDAAGQADLGNGDDGVSLLVGNNNTIGGTAPEARNLISGNTSVGVALDAVPTNNKVEGNLIGTNKNGTGPLGNAADGVEIVDADNTVGGATPGAANTIAFNGRNGVSVVEDSSSGISTGNRVLSNSIFSNGELGIDIGGDGRTNNDPGDADTGANDLQNFPVLTSSVTSGGQTTVTGTLNSAPNKVFLVQFFSNPQGEDEGKQFLGEKSVTTDDSGNASFSFTPSQAVSAGQNVTATATDEEGNTSEFSAPLAVTAAPPPNVTPPSQPPPTFTPPAQPSPEKAKQHKKKKGKKKGKKGKGGGGGGRR